MFSLITPGEAKKRGREEWNLELLRCRGAHSMPLSFNFSEQSKEMRKKGEEVSVY